MRHITSCPSCKTDDTHIQQTLLVHGLIPEYMYTHESDYLCRLATYFQVFRTIRVARLFTLMRHISNCRILFLVSTVLTHTNLFSLLATVSKYIHLIIPKYMCTHQSHYFHPWAYSWLLYCCKIIYRDDPYCYLTTLILYQHCIYLCKIYYRHATHCSLSINAYPSAMYLLQDILQRCVILSYCHNLWLIPLYRYTCQSDYLCRSAIRHCQKYYTHDPYCYLTTLIVHCQGISDSYMSTCIPCHHIISTHEHIVGCYISLSTLLPQDRYTFTSHSGYLSTT